MSHHAHLLPSNTFDELVQNIINAAGHTTIMLQLVSNFGKPYNFMMTLFFIRRPQRGHQAFGM